MQSTGRGMISLEPQSEHSTQPNRSAAAGVAVRDSANIVLRAVASRKYSVIAARSFDYSTEGR
jgi:hypothetical protein